MGEHSDNWVEDCGECLVVLFQGRESCGSLLGLRLRGEAGHSYRYHDQAVGGNGKSGSCLGLMGEDLVVVLVRGVSTALASVASRVPWTKVYPS